jgi:peptidase M23-like protein
MRRNRTTARGVLFLAAIVGLVAGTARAATTGKAPAHIVFPVVGDVQYVDDFGAPRPGGPHQGNDLLATKKSPAVAAEAGKVKYWTTSRTAGCMLYLYGQSGTMYEYIHLNNDVTMKNDNRGKCVRGTAYAVKNGARVLAGQQIGYVGDSGDADGAHAHLHFEVHPNGGKAADPYPYLQSAYKLLFASKPGAPFVVTLTGAVVSATDGELAVKVATSQAWPSNLTVTKVNRTITLAVSPSAVVESITPSGVVRAAASLSLAVKGQKVVVWTQPAPATLKAARADDGALTAALVQLSGP